MLRDFCLFDKIKKNKKNRTYVVINCYTNCFLQILTFLTFIILNKTIGFMPLQKYFEKRLILGVVIFSK